MKPRCADLVPATGVGDRGGSFNLVVPGMPIGLLARYSVASLSGSGKESYQVPKARSARRALLTFFRFTRPRRGSLTGRVSYTPPATVGDEGVIGGGVMGGASGPRGLSAGVGPLRGSGGIARGRSSPRPKARRRPPSSSPP